MLIEHELLSQPLEHPADGEEKIWRVGGMNDVETIAKEDESGIEEQDRRSDQVFDEMAGNSAKRRQGEAIDANALPLFIKAGIAPFGAHDRDLESNLGQGQGFIPNPSITRDGRVLNQEQHPERTSGDPSGIAHSDHLRPRPRNRARGSDLGPPPAAVWPQHKSAIR